MQSRSVEEYLTLPYTIEVVRDSTGDYSGYVARVVEFPGCMTQADTFEEVGEMIREAMQLWLEMCIEAGQPVPEPRPVEEYSGKFVVRLPKSLHRELAARAEREGVSLNALVNVALARYAGDPGATFKRHKVNGATSYRRVGSRGQGREIQEPPAQQGYDPKGEPE